MDLFNAPTFRSSTSASMPSLNSSSTSITRVASGPLLHNLAMNKTSLAEDHMFYKCKAMLQRLAKIEGMEPYIASSQAAAERCAEQQALALSQQLSQNDGPSFRSSMGSGGFSIYLDHSSGLQSTPATPSTNNIFTFTAGVLPASLTLDPVTQLWKLFQRGVPLCLLFNRINPDTPIAVLEGDDLRMCKKAVYEFVVAVKTHLTIEDDIMFTISNVFSDNTHDLLRIIKVVKYLLDTIEDPLQKEKDAELDADIANLKITDDRSKVFKELIETERKYVLDLELLLDYKSDLQSADALSSEQLHILFPNLSEIIDFHRKLLSGLECNIDVPTKYQRVGSIFIHASNGPFRAYEPWTIGQIAAIDLINKEAPNLKKVSTLIDPGFELQSYIIKPIQRLCKYPLLLKELIKTYTDSTAAPYYNELLIAHGAMKEVANKVNEAQRRSENVGFLQNLVERVKNWRGCNLRDQGELLHHSTVSIKDGDTEKEYIAYLFENIIYFFQEASLNEKPKDKKKREILSSRKKSAAGVSGSTANLLENLNGAKDKSTLELKGRVFITEIYNISSGNLNGYTLVISWSGKKESGSFVLRFRYEEPRNQWEACLRQLKANEMNHQLQWKMRDSRGSLGTNSSYEHNGYHGALSESPGHRSQEIDQRHISSSSTLSMMRTGRNGSTSHPQTQAQSDTSTGSIQSAHVSIKVVYNKSEIKEPLQVQLSISFRELQQKLASYVAASPTVSEDVIINKMKYKDEEGDFVMMDLSDDWQLALEMIDELAEQADQEKALTIWVS